MSIETSARDDTGRTLAGVNLRAVRAGHAIKYALLGRQRYGGGGYYPHPTRDLPCKSRVGLSRLVGAVNRPRGGGDLKRRARRMERACRGYPPVRGGVVGDAPTTSR